MKKTIVEQHQVRDQYLAQLQLSILTKYPILCDMYDSRYFAYSHYTQIFPTMRVLNLLQLLGATDCLAPSRALI